MRALSETLEKQTWMRYCLDLQGSYSFSTQEAMQIKNLGAVLELCTVYYRAKGGRVRLFWKRVNIGFMMNGTLNHSPGRYEIDSSDYPVWNGTRWIEFDAKDGEVDDQSSPTRDFSIDHPARNPPHSKAASVSTQEAHLYSSNLLSLFLILQHT